MTSLDAHTEETQRRLGRPHADRLPQLPGARRRRRVGVPDGSASWTPYDRILRPAPAPTPRGERVGSAQLVSSLQALTHISAHSEAVCKSWLCSGLMNCHRCITRCCTGTHKQTNAGKSGGREAVWFHTHTPLWARLTKYKWKADR